MSTTKADVGVIVARFQIPALHPMHRQLLATAMERHKKVVVCLGVSAAGVPTKEDPLPFVARQQMIQELYPPEQNRGLIIVPLPDQEDDDAWSRLLDQTVASVYPNQSALVYGGRDSFAKYYTGKLPLTDITAGILSLDTSSGSQARQEIADQPPVPDKLFREGIVYATQQQRAHAYPTVDMALICRAQGGKPELLLVRKPNTTLFRFPGGFVDPGDLSLESAAARETREETGIVLQPSDFRYRASFRQNDWRYTKSDRIITTLFTAEVTMEQRLSTQAGDDVDAAQWFPIDESLRTIIHPVHEYLLEEILRLAAPSKDAPEEDAP